MTRKRIIFMVMSILSLLGLSSCSSAYKSLPVVKDEPVGPNPMCGAYTQQRDPTEMSS